VILTTWQALRFQTAWSPLILEVTLFHDLIIVILVTITSLLLVVNVDLFINKSNTTSPIEQVTLEVWWTLIPACLLVLVAFPSLRLLYFIDEVEIPQINLRVIGHQWYWEYSYPDFIASRFDSYLQPRYTSPRLLDVDNRVCLIRGCLTRVLVTSSDVLHAWSLPSLGVKVDAVPGRINQLRVQPVGRSILFGQCSEICGANHRFIPIVIEVLPMSLFNKWLC